MSLSAVIVLNAIFVGALLAALTYVCLIPFRVDRADRTRKPRLSGEAQYALAEERAAA